MGAAKPLMALMVGLMMATTVTALEPVQDTAESCGAPPCGYIVPILDMDFPEKQSCGGGRLLFSEGPPEDCMMLMEKDGSITLDGVVRWYWEASEDGTYPKELEQDIVISFGGTSSNPPYIHGEILCETDPCEFVIDDVALFHPDNFEQRENAQGNPTFWYVYERPIQAQFTRTGDPGPGDMQRLADREGVAHFFMKAKSSESGPRFRESFGVEEFRFNTCSDPAVAAALEACPATDNEPVTDESEDIPGPVALVPIALLGAVLIARRRL